MATKDEMDRIKKLLALSESSSFGDAANAAALAAKLLHELNLTIEDVDLEEGQDPLDEYDKEQVDFQGSDRWRYRLLNSIAQANNARTCYYSGGYQSGRYGAVVGRAHERELTVWMYGYLVGQLKRMAFAAWKIEQQKSQMWYSPSRHVFRNNFFLGAESVIARRLRQQRNEQQMASAESTALVVNRDALAERASEELLGELKTDKARRSTRDDASYRAGQQAGRDVSFNRPVTSGSAPAQIGER